MAAPQFKVSVLGDGGVGKTTWLKALRTGEFETKYIATLGVEVVAVPLQTTKGEIVFNLWDTAGQEKFGGLRDGYYIQSNAGILFADPTMRSSINNLGNWNRDLVRVCDNVPKVIVFNKMDMVTGDPVQATGASKGKLSKISPHAFGMSVKEATTQHDPKQLYVPLLQLARVLTGVNDLDLVNTPVGAELPTLDLSTDDAAGGAGGGSAGAADGPWTCLACEAVNASNTQSCGVCTSPRKAGQAKAKFSGKSAPKPVAFGLPKAKTSKHVNMWGSSTQVSGKFSFGAPPSSANANAKGGFSFGGSPPKANANAKGGFSFGGSPPKAKQAPNFGSNKAKATKKMMKKGKKAKVPVTSTLEEMGYPDIDADDQNARQIIQDVQARLQDALEGIDPAKTEQSVYLDALTASAQRIAEERQYELDERDLASLRKNIAKSTKLAAWDTMANKVLKQVHPDTGTSSQAKAVMRDLLTSTVVDIGFAALQMVAKTEQLIPSFVPEEMDEGVTPRTIVAAMALTTPGELLKHGRSEACKAVTKYTSVAENSGGSVPFRDAARAAGLQFSPLVVRNTLASRLGEGTMTLPNGAPRFTKEAFVAMAAFSEYMCAEIWELSGNAARDNRKVRITPRHMQLAISNDEELNRMYGGRIFCGAGVIPNIRRQLLDKDPAEASLPTVNGYSPGVAALREIRAAQKSTDLCIHHDAMHALILEILADYGGLEVDITPDAMAALQIAAETHLVGLFSAANLAAIHRESTMVEPRDMQLARFMQPSHIDYSIKH